MTRIHLALQEGFQNDTVVAQLDGAEVYRQAGLKTRMQIGLAGKVEFDAPAGPAKLRVDVPTRNAGLTLPLEVPAAGSLYVGVSMTPDGTLTHKATGEPFRYA